MKLIVSIGFFGLLLTSCLREKYSGEDCLHDIRFKMQDVPYIYQNQNTLEYRPYYSFTEQLDLFLFAGEKLWQSQRYDYNYCRTHSIIPFRMEPGEYTYLFVANLFDPKELDWTFENGELKARFSIVDYEEPSVLLAASSQIEGEQDTVGVELLILVSRLEIQLINPPAWVNGLDVTVRDIASSILSDFTLGGDTTHINKQISFDNQGAAVYQFGVNTFPTYPDHRALLVIELRGTSAVAPILVDDNRLRLLSGFVTRLDITFKEGEQISVSIDVDGKWEVVDGGNIII